jgi:hypothetical protein
MNLGNAMIGCGMFLVLYGIAMYYRRLHLMVNAKPYGYADSVGPAVLATFMIAILGSFTYVVSIVAVYIIYQSINNLLLFLITYVLL